MDYHLYFHNDFDGMASGAVMLNFLRSRGDDVVSFTPITYSQALKKKWAGFKFKEPFVILDFLYHPRASWWFDHHYTSFLTDEWRDGFRDDKNRAFDSTKKSACDLLAGHLKKEFNWKPSKFISDLIGWATVIDGALYKSAKEAIESKQPAIKLAKATNPVNFEKGTEAKYFERIIKSLAKEPIAKTIQIPAVRKEIKRIENVNRKIKEIFKNILIVTGKVVFIDGTKTDVQFSNYHGYYFYPDIDYSVTVEFYGKYYHLSVGKNLWKKTPAKVHIGEMLKKYGGGGHRTVGGAERKTKKEILKIAGEVIEYLNNHG
jgi:oligoribonuclease NrnB/cAMP/cGMP phosphodiesterase (DHH superfamily)